MVCSPLLRAAPDIPVCSLPQHAVTSPNLFAASASDPTHEISSSEDSTNIDHHEKEAPTDDLPGSPIDEEQSSCVECRERESPSCCPQDLSQGAARRDQFDRENRTLWELEPVPRYPVVLSKINPGQLRALDWMSAAGKQRFETQRDTLLARWGVTADHRGTCVLIPIMWSNLDPMEVLAAFNYSECPDSESPRLVSSYPLHNPGPNDGRHIPCWTTPLLGCVRRRGSTRRAGPGAEPSLTTSWVAALSDLWKALICATTEIA